MKKIKTLSIKDLIPIKEIKEDVNLMMFRSNLFSFQDMQINNQLMEAIANVEIPINSSN